MRSAFIVALACAVAASSSVAAADAPHKGPYLQHLGSSSVDVRVELGAPAAVSVDVAVDGRDGGAPGQTVTSPAAAFHSVHVAGLGAATRYRYAVRVGSGPAYRGTFVTAPDGASREPFTFVVYGDNRSDGAAHERVVQAIARESYGFLVNTGDFVIGGGDDAAWQSFFDIEEPILRDHCLFACIGNHELFDDRQAAHFERYFGASEPSGPSAPAPPLYGSFRWGRARFFLLNAFEDFGAGPEHAWLVDELTRADQEPGVDLRVAVVHHGPYSAGVHGGNKRLLAAHIAELLVSHRVDLLLEGHDHIYERGEAGGLKYLLTGGGGAPLYRDVHPVPSTRKAEATYNYVLATVADDVVSILSKRPDGSIIEQCSFARGGSWLCDPHPAPPSPEGAGASPVAPAPSPSPRCGCSVPGRPTDGAVAVLAAMVLASVLVRRRKG
jgi:MYXO-CTERM domain-containing protein